MKVILILPTFPYPRYNKRIKSISEEYEIEVYGFDRGQYKKNEYDYEVSVLGQMENKKYVQRIKSYSRLIKLIKKKRKEKNVLFSFFSFDTAIWGKLLLKRGQYIYEIGDFAYLGLPHKIRDIITNLDLKIIKQSEFTILTSGGYKEYLLAKDKRIPEEKLLVIPNRISKNVLSYPRRKRELSKSLRFGFVGILRYPNTILRFIKIIGKNYPTHSFIFYGEGGITTDFLELCKSYPNLKYGGAFKNPEDLEHIYNSFDVHIACYDTEGQNQRMAEPNKLFESIYFGAPLIASEGTYFGEKVMKLGAGYSINATSDQNIITLIESLTPEKIKELSDHLLEIPTDKLINSDKDLLDRLSSI